MLDLSRGDGPHQPHGPAPQKSVLNAVPVEVWEEEVGSSFDIWGLVRRYLLLAVVLVVLGGAAGLLSVAYTQPVYKARVLVELLGVNEALLRNSIEPAESQEFNSVNVQTQILLLRNGPFLRRVAERLQSETVPPAPAQNDIFMRLRRKLRTQEEDPLKVMQEGLSVAANTFDVRPVNGTRLLEMSCDSTHPDLAAQFINTMASEYVEESVRSRTQNAQKTTEWLSTQIEEAKIKMQEAEDRLRDFVQNSGNLFASQETTLDDVKLKQLQGELATVQAARIASQARHEAVAKASGDSLVELLNDTGLSGIHSRIVDLQRERAALETTFTADHPKVQKITAQQTVLQSEYDRALEAAKARVKADYDSALRRERLLSGAYAGQASRVGAQSGRAAEYNALRREVETLRQMYQSLLMQSSQTSLSNSVPVTPVRLVESSGVPQAPYKPVPPINISFGVMGGLVLTCGIAFLRERADRSVKAPGTTRTFVNAPELGIIPNVSLDLPQQRRLGFLPGNRNQESDLTVVRRETGERSLAQWNDPRSLVAESFRGAVASLVREIGARTNAITLLVTSPNPGEGKTTVTANLAIALAESGRRVLLIDADFRKPQMHRVFATPKFEGAAELLEQDGELTKEVVEAAIQATDQPNLCVLVSGQPRKGVPAVLHSRGWRPLLQLLHSQYDLILIDSPPMLQLADARVLAPLADGVVLVLRAGATDRPSVLEAFQRLSADRLPLVGTILNDWNPGKERLHQYYHYHQE